MKPHPVTTAHLAESELDEIRTLIEQRSAILFDSSRERFFSTRIREYVDEKGLATGTELLRLVRGSSIEYEALLERLLTQETSFFRYPAVFAALEKKDPARAPGAEILAEPAHAADLERRLLDGRRAVLDRRHALRVA